MNIKNKTTKYMKLFSGFVAVLIFFITATGFVYASTPPKVITGVAGPVNDTSAGLLGSAVPGSSQIITAWIEWGNSPTLSSFTATQRNTYSTAVNFTENISGLSPGTIYYYRAVAEGDGDTVRGETRTFLTTGIRDGVSIKIKTLTPLQNAVNSAILRGEIDPKGDRGIKRWFEWGVGNSLINTTIKTQQGQSIETYSHTLAGISAGTRYSFRAVAENNKGVRFYGARKQFVTLTHKPTPTPTPAPAPTPIIIETTTLLPDTTTKESVVFRGVVKSTKAISNNVWFEWGRTPNLGNKTIVKKSGTSQSVYFNETLKNLPEGTAYFYRAVAKNNLGTFKGETLVARTSGIAPHKPSMVTEKQKPVYIPKEKKDEIKKEKEVGTVLCPEEDVCPPVNNFGATVFGVGFLPDSLIGWLFLLLIIIAIIALSRNLYGTRKKGQNEENSKKEKEKMIKENKNDDTEFKLPGK